MYGVSFSGSLTEKKSKQRAACTPKFLQFMRRPLLKHPCKLVIEKRIQRSERILVTLTMTVSRNTNDFPGYRYNAFYKKRCLGTMQRLFCTRNVSYLDTIKCAFQCQCLFSSVTTG